MKFRFLLFIGFTILLLIHTYKGECLEPSNLTLSKSLVQVEKELTEINVLQRKLLKVYIFSHLKSKDFRGNFRETGIYLSLNKFTLRKILSLEEKENKLKKLQAQIHQNLLLTQLKTQISVHPLNPKISLNVGSYSLKISKKTSVSAPIAGVVKGMKLTEEGYLLSIENERCVAHLYGLDEITVNLGQKVVLKEVLGTVEKPKVFKFDLNCVK